jgi:hypothetical protein
MRAREFMREARDAAADLSRAAPDVDAAIRGALSIPDISQNKANGSSYLQYRFGIAMAGAPDYPTKAAGAMAGDPLLTCYTDAELQIINAAAQMVGAGTVKKLSSNRSEELSNTNTTSPVNDWNKHTVKKKKKKVKEAATAGATSSANIGVVPNPHLSPGKARGKKSYTGTPGHSGWKSPPQPKPKKQKPTDNALNKKGVSLFGGPAIKR